MISLGGMTVIIISRKKKLNLRSLTESELVGAYDCLVLVMWSTYFIGAQGYSM